MPEKKSIDKRVLIISNNVLSNQNNNGKTLLSFFRNLPKNNIAQIYFSSETADYNLASGYYRITDLEIFNILSAKSKKKFAGGEVSDGVYGFAHQQSAALINATSLKGLDSIRLARELAWKIIRIDREGLSQWVKKINPDVIFFCAGDSVFAYRIYEMVCSFVPSVRKVVYVTDDYVLPRRKISPFWWLRRGVVCSSLKKSALGADVFVTISKEMREEYRDRFGKDSINIFNAPENLKIKSHRKSPRDDLVLVYAGGLHFERWKTLYALAISLRNFNAKYGRSVSLKIFSHQKIDEKIVKYIQVSGVSKFHGSLDLEGVRCQLNDADILVHVESFSPKYIESTRLSISTKIAEYITVGTTILAIGPGSVSSMRYLSASAYCVTSLSELEGALDSVLCRDLSVKPVATVLEMDKNIRTFEEAVFV